MLRIEILGALITKIDFMYNHVKCQTIIIYTLFTKYNHTQSNLGLSLYICSINLFLFLFHWVLFSI